MPLFSRQNHSGLECAPILQTAHSAYHIGVHISPRNPQDIHMPHMPMIHIQKHMRMGQNLLLPVITIFWGITIYTPFRMPGVGF